MDIYRLARLLTIDRKLPREVQVINLVIGHVMPMILKRGGINTREAENALLDFLSGEGYQIGAIPHVTPQQAENRFRRTVQFSLITMKGQGNRPMTRPLLRDAEPGEYQPMDNRELIGRYKAYIPTPYALHIYGSGGADQLVSTIRNDIIPGFNAPLEGPTEERISQKYYLLESNWREHLILKAADKATCWCCGRDMLEFYGDIGWKALDAHHLDALGNRPKPTPTAPGGVELVCCSCHAVHHRTSIPMEDLRVQLRRDIPG